MESTLISARLPKELAIHLVRESHRLSIKTNHRVTVTDLIRQGVELVLAKSKHRRITQ